MDRDYNVGVPRLLCALFGHASQVRQALQGVAVVVRSGPPSLAAIYLGAAICLMFPFLKITS
jgi:hypothetical protein